MLSMGPRAGYAAGLNLLVFPPGQNLPNGYLLTSNAEVDQLLFLLPNFYDPMVLNVAERTKQPVIVGELLTLGSAPMMNAYARPV